MNLNKCGYFACLISMTVITFAITNLVHACTGITLVAKDGSVIQARTEEWGPFNLESKIMVVPRGTEFIGLTPDGSPGLKWKATYGAVSFNALGKVSSIDGMNEKGLACSVLYLPRDTKYAPYDPEKASSTIGPQDVANWILSTQADVEGVREHLLKINVAPVKEKALGDIPPPIHFLVTDRTGKTIVIQFTNGKVNIYDNPVGALTNSPDFPWHLTNLNNYLGLTSGAKQGFKVGELELSPFGVGTGMLGLPGDFSPPSRFVRAVAYRNTVRPLETGYEGAMEALRILNNFDIPSGAVMTPEELPTDDTLGSTQWTTAMDTKNLQYYYKTMFNSRVRSIDLTKIDFDKKGIRYRFLDLERTQDIEQVVID